MPLCGYVCVLVDLRGCYVVEQRIEQRKSLQKIKIQSLDVFAPATTLKKT